MIHTDLEVYKKSLLLVKSVYELTKKFPKEEMWGLSSQMRRAAISIPSNISEGSGRRSNKELSQFINISLGSVAELETQINISLMLNFMDSNEKDLLIKELTTIRMMLLNLMKSITHP